MAEFIKRVEERWLLYQFRRPQQLGFLSVYFRLRAQGVGPREVLEHMEQAQDLQWQLVAKGVQLNLREGKVTTESFKDYIDREIYEALKAPEETEEYAEKALQMIRNIKEQAHKNNEWVGKLAQPFAYLMLMLAAYAGLAGSFFPALEGMVALPVAGAPYWVRRVGEFILSWWPMLLASAVILVAVIRYALPRWSNEARRVLDRYAPLSFYRELSGALFQRRLFILMNAGKPLKGSLAVLSAGCNPHVGVYILYMKMRIRDGMSHGDILDVGLLNSGDINELRLLSGTQGFVAALGVLADDAQNRADGRLLLAAKSLSLILYFILGSMLLGFLVAISSPISQMLQSQGIN